MVCWVQQAWGCSGGVRISGRSRSRVIDAGRSGQRILPVAAGHGDAVVAVGVVGGEAAELVAGEFGGLRVVRGGLLRGGGAGQRPEFQQGAAGSHGQ